MGNRDEVAYGLVIVGGVKAEAEVMVESEALGMLRSIVKDSE